MPIPDTMKLIEKDGVLALSIELTNKEYDILSVLGKRELRGIWGPWQDSPENLSNHPSNIELLENLRIQQQEIITAKQASVGEKIDNNKHYQFVMRAFEDAGLEGLTDEELADRCVHAQALAQGHHNAGVSKETLRKGWANRTRSIRGILHKADFIIRTGEKRPTASSKARHRAIGVEPKGTAAVWRLRNLQTAGNA